MLRRVRAWLSLSVILLSCGRTELKQQFGDHARDEGGAPLVQDAGSSVALDAANPDAADAAVAGFDAAAPTLDAAVPGPVPPAPSPQRCVMPALPLSSLSGCIEALCACDVQAFANCDLDCWTKFACRIQTCTNDPTRAECAVGCPDAPAAEQALNRCYRRTPECTGVLR